MELNKNSYEKETNFPLSKMNLFLYCMFWDLNLHLEKNRRKEKHHFNISLIMIKVNLCLKKYFLLNHETLEWGIYLSTWWQLSPHLHRCLSSRRLEQKTFWQTGLFSSLHNLSFQSCCDKGKLVIGVISIDTTDVPVQTLLFTKYISNL